MSDFYENLGKAIFSLSPAGVAARAGARTGKAISNSPEAKRAIKGAARNLSKTIPALSPAAAAAYAGGKTGKKLSGSKGARTAAGNLSRLIPAASPVGAAAYAGGKTGQALARAAKRRADSNSKDKPKGTSPDTSSLASSTKELKKAGKKNWAKGTREAVKAHNSRRAPGRNLGRDLTMANENAMASYRAKRTREGDYKGKYYGPDEFKGNTHKLSKWRAAGSPKDKSKFV